MEEKAGSRHKDGETERRREVAGGKRTEKLEEALL